MATYIFAGGGSAGHALPVTRPAWHAPPGDPGCLPIRRMTAIHRPPQGTAFEAGQAVLPIEPQGPLREAEALPIPLTCAGGRVDRFLETGRRGSAATPAASLAG